MPISRRALIATFGLGSAATLLPRSAFAAYPDRPIHLIVPFAPGGNADIVGRIVGERISSALGQPVVVDNRGGAGGSIGAEVVARATPDGYTLLVGSNGPLTVNPFVQAKLGYDPLKDFAPVALTSYVPHVIILNDKVEAKTLPDLIALSKKTPVNIATSGVGSASHMTLERFKAATGANVTHIPYKSGGALMPDLMGGSIQAAMTEFSTALPLHKGGKARIVAIAAAVALAIGARYRDLHRGWGQGFHRRELYRHPGAYRHAGTHYRAGAEGDRRRTDRRRCCRQIARHGFGNRHGGADDA